MSECDLLGPREPRFLTNPVETRRDPFRYPETIQMAVPLRPRVFLDIAIDGVATGR